MLVTLLLLLLLLPVASPCVLFDASPYMPPFPPCMLMSVQVFCDECNSKFNALRRDCISRLPNLLLVHLKRFELDYETFDTVKVLLLPQLPLVPPPPASLAHHLPFFPTCVALALPTGE